MPFRRRTKRHGRHHFVRKRRTPSPLIACNAFAGVPKCVADAMNPTQAIGEGMKEGAPASRQSRDCERLTSRNAAQVNATAPAGARAENSQRSSAESSVKHASNPFVHIPKHAKRSEHWHATTPIPSDAKPNFSAYVNDTACDWRALFGSAFASVIVARKLRQTFVGCKASVGQQQVEIMPGPGQHMVAE